MSSQPLWKVVQPGPGSTLIYLVRHGVTDWNQEHRFQGQLDVPLNAEGVAQAVAVAQWIRDQAIPFSAIYSSDLSRAAQTARSIGSELGLTPIYRVKLREINCGLWQGLTMKEVQDRFPEEVAHWRRNRVEHGYPQGENMLQLQERVSSCFQAIANAHPGQALVIVSHGAALAGLICSILGWNLADSMASGAARMSNTGVTVVKVSCTGRQAELLLLNSSDHLSNPTGMDSAMDLPGEAVTP